MGAFLTTSLMTKFQVAKSEWNSINGDSKEKHEFMRSIFVDTDIFDMSESAGTIYFDVKEEVLKEELIPFLKTFFNDFHGKDKECDLIIESLEEKKEVKEWLEFAYDGGFQNFQRDPYGSVRFSQIEISYESIILAMEGKISMEMYGKHFSFFESLIKKVYADFKLSNLIQISIS